MSKGMSSAAARVWSRAAALQAEEAVMMASPSLRPQIYEDPVVYRPPPAVPRTRAFPPPYPPPRAPPSTSRPPTGPAHEHQDIKEQDEMWSDPRRHVEVEVFDEPAQPVKAQPQVEKKPAQVERPAAVSATVAASQKQADKLESQYTAKPSPRPVPVAPAVKTAAAPTPTPKPAVAAVTPEVKKPFVVDPSVDPMTYSPQVEADPEDVPVVLRSSAVPSSRLGRSFHYGSLGASLALGAAGETFRRTTGGGGQGSVFMSDANVRRSVATSGRMRGAALKLGQFMSIQDNTILPPELERVLAQVQAHANYMPDWQLDRVMTAELGPEWQAKFLAFDRTPVAAASIGQVHRATLKDGTHVAVKVQFPGVAESIGSDIANLSIVLRGSASSPKGMYLQNTIAVMKRELEDECDYEREADAGKKFAASLEGDSVFDVPRVIEECTSKRVLTTEWADGRPLSKLRNSTQEQRDSIGTNVLRLCLEELFKFRFMQTDPNWGNFLFLPSSGRIQSIDFGASREYTPEFMAGWYKLSSAASSGDKPAMVAESQSLGYSTGEEEPDMVDAHIASMSASARPFQHQGLYDFSKQTVTDEVRANIPVMLEKRLTPPPAPTYSLNRKLSGAFLMCAKLGSQVDCKKLWDEATETYQREFAQAKV